jgi:Beta-lactamase enzyme family
VSERRRIGPPPRMRPASPARPVHAGGLAPWERLVFTVVFALMVAFVVIVTISSAHARRPVPGTGTTAPAGGQASGGGVQPGPAAHGGEKALGTRVSSASAARQLWDRRLGRALAPVLARQTGQLAVGVVDTSTGASAVYGGGQHFHTASIVKADILAALLLQRQDSGVALSDADEDLATRMIESSDDDAATDLWQLAGTGSGLASANARLGLRHTTPGTGNYWGLTSTTVGDQLRLLRDLTGDRSVLNAGARAYELSLMQNVQSDQRWGVPAAATPGSVSAVKNGWLPDGSSRQWVINSIGVLEHQHQRLLLAVLSSGQPTEGTGIAQSQAAAQAAAACMTARY